MPQFLSLAAGCIPARLWEVHRNSANTAGALCAAPVQHAKVFIAAHNFQIVAMLRGLQCALSASKCTMIGLIAVLIAPFRCSKYLDEEEMPPLLAPAAEQPEVGVGSPAKRRSQRVRTTPVPYIPYFGRDTPVKRSGPPNPLPLPGLLPVTCQDAIIS